MNQLTDAQRAQAAAMTTLALTIASKAKRALPDKRFADEYDSAALLTLVRAIPKFDPNRGYSLKAYVFTAVMREMRSTRRRLRLRGYRSKTMGTPIVIRHDDQIQARVNNEADVRDLLQHVRQPDRQHVVDYFYGGQTQDEIARAHGITKQRVHQRIHRAIRRMREVGAGRIV